MNKLKCCLYILMAKRYVVFTVNEEKGFGKRQDAKWYGCRGEIRTIGLKSRIEQ